MLNFLFRIFPQDFWDFESSYLWNGNRYQLTVKNLLLGFQWFFILANKKLSIISIHRHFNLCSVFRGGGKFCHFHVSLLLIASLRIPYLLNFVKIDIYFFYILYPKFWAHSSFQNDIVTILSKHTNNSYRIWKNLWKLSAESNILNSNSRED